jgi:hypothetical protein
MSYKNDINALQTERDKMKPLILEAIELQNKLDGKIYPAVEKIKEEFRVKESYLSNLLDQTKKEAGTHEESYNLQGEQTARAREQLAIIDSIKKIAITAENNFQMHLNALDDTCAKFKQVFPSQNILDLIAPGFDIQLEFNTFEQRIKKINLEFEAAKLHRDETIKRFTPEMKKLSQLTLMAEETDTKMLTSGNIIKELIAKGHMIVEEMHIIIISLLSTLKQEVTTAEVIMT